MKRIVAILTLVIGLGLFSLTTVKSVHAEDVVVEKAIQQAKKDIAENKKGDNPDFDKEEITKRLANRDMDWVTKNILVNYKAYHQKASLTDWAQGIAHVLSDFFGSINQYIVYGLFDKALSTTFNLAKITSGVDDVLNKVGKNSKAVWASQAFKNLLYTAFAVGIVWVAVKNLQNSRGFKMMFILISLAVGGTVWINSGNKILTTVNDYTSKVQTAVFSATSTQDDGYSDTGASFQSVIRKQYFDRSVGRTFALANFGKSSIEEAEKEDMGDPYRLIGGHVIDDTTDEMAKKNKYISKDGGFEWYQTSISFMSPFMSVAYGIPLLMIGVLNVVVQLGAVLFYYLAPFTVLLSLFPRFSNTFLKTMLTAFGLLFAKIGLLFAIMFVNWVGDLVDIIVPVSDSASAFFNSILYVLLMFMLWKNKSWLVSAVTGSSKANGALNKVSLTRTAKQAGRQGKNGSAFLGGMALGGLVGFEKGANKAFGGVVNRFGKKGGTDDEKEPRQRERSEDETKITPPTTPNTGNEGHGGRDTAGFGVDEKSKPYHRNEDFVGIGQDNADRGKATDYGDFDKKKPEYKRQTNLNKPTESTQSNLGEYLARKQELQDEQRSRLGKDLQK